MKALVYHGPGNKAWEDVPDAAVQEPTDVVVRVDTTTICGTDLHILQGDVPAVTDGRILGHEAVGTVTAVGDAVTGFSVGDRVLVPAITKCGRCEYCQRGMPSHCQTVGGIGWIFGHLIDGTQAELVRVPYADTSLYAVPQSVTNEQAIFLADSLPTGYEVGVLAGGVRPGHTVAVVGAGAVGLSAILTTGLWGASKVIAVDSNTFRLKKALEFGATDVVEVGPSTVADVIALTDGLGVDVAIEAVGYPETLLTAASWCGPAARSPTSACTGRRSSCRCRTCGSERDHDDGPGRHGLHPDAAEDGRERAASRPRRWDPQLHLRPDGRGLRRVQERRRPTRRSRS
jgi:alcohol dehydrogenase